MSLSCIPYLFTSFEIVHNRTLLSFALLCSFLFILRMVDVRNSNCLFYEWAWATVEWVFSKSQSNENLICFTNRKRDHSVVGTLFWWPIENSHVVAIFWICIETGTGGICNLLKVALELKISTNFFIDILKISAFKLLKMMNRCNSREEE